MELPTPSNLIGLIGRAAPRSHGHALRRRARAMGTANPAAALAFGQLHNPLSMENTDEGTPGDVRFGSRLVEGGPASRPIQRSRGRPFCPWAIWAPIFLISAVG